LDADCRGLNAEKAKGTVGTKEARNSIDSVESQRREDGIDDEVALIWQKFNAWVRKDG